jgi:putative aldouronate transport system permease protein
VYGLRQTNIANGLGEKAPLKYRASRSFRRHWQLYVFLLPVAAYFIMFHYAPLYGVQIAFRDYKFVKGITGSKWVGLKQFSDFFKSYYSGRLVLNTFLLNIYGLLWSFPVPIIMAILLNQFAHKRLKSAIQTLIYVPHFISTVVMVGLLYLFLSPSNGIVNKGLLSLGASSIFFMMEPGWFRTLFIASDIWQHAGWSTILFIAALTAIDQELYEAASVDGASKVQKILFIDVPHLASIAGIMLILSCGSMLVSNTDKALLMQTPGNMPVSDIIGVYVYQQGLGKAQFSYTAAINLFVNAVNFVTIITVNTVSRKLGETSLF